MSSSPFPIILHVINIQQWLCTWRRYQLAEMTMSSLVRLPGAVDGGLRLFFLLLILLPYASASDGGPEPSGAALNIIDFGAVADGETDAREALQAAWGEACGSGKAGGAMLVPRGTFLVGPVKLQGPCKSSVVLQVEGVVRAPTDLAVFDHDYWIGFESVDGFTLTGGGTFDGQGASAWPHNQCSELVHCKDLPKSITFRQVTGGTIQGISSVNSKFFHIDVLESKQIKLQNITITAPEDSPNTDGVHIAQSSGITVVDSIIRTGDDCVSIGPGATNVAISGIACGPGHGISIGSLGKYPDEQDVWGVSVRKCAISNTKNGVRIKTFPSSYVSSAYNITFEDIVVSNASHPIIIDQEYCPIDGSCGNQPPSRVSISNVKFSNIRGTSASKTAVSLVCSEAVPCRNVALHDIDLEYVGGSGKTTSECSNVQATFTGYMNPPPCTP